MASFDFLAWLVRLNKRGRHDCREARRGLGVSRRGETSPGPGLRCFSAHRLRGLGQPAPLPLSSLPRSGWGGGLWGSGLLTEEACLRGGS